MVQARKKAKLPRASAVVVAAGSSTRMGGRTRKPYLKLRGRPILSWTLAALGRVPAVREIVLVTRPDDRDRAIQAVKLAKLPKRVQVTFADGGARRQDSVGNGIRAASERSGVVMIHDAARPFPPQDAMKTALVEALACGAAILAIPVRDTVKRQRGKNARIERTVPREGLWLAQTPQVLRRAEAVKLFARLAKSPRAEVTDDASVFERFGKPVALVESSTMNLKVTRPEDLPIAEALLRQGLVK